MLKQYLRNQRKKGKKGFTLIELIVVIAILVILMALMIPLLSKYMSSAQNARDKANARAVYGAAAAYAADRLVAEEEVSINVDSDELSAYFNDTGSATYGATLTSDGAVTEAYYNSTYYPERP